MMDENDTLGVLRESRKIVAKLRAQVNFVSSQHVNKKAVLEAVASYIRAYFKDDRPIFATFFGECDVLTRLDERMKEVLRFTHGRTQKERYLECFASLQREFSQLERLAVEQVFPVSRTGDSESSHPRPLERPADKARVFIVHGHDEVVKITVARFLEQLGLNAVILHEQPNLGRTIIEKLEACTGVQFAVVLLTPDDLCQAKMTPATSVLRARQNVIFEWGFLLSRLGRTKVCALRKGDVEMLSDMQGVLYHDLDQGGGWQNKLAGELKAAGLPIDLNRAVRA